MTVTYNQKEAEKELSVKEMQEKTIIAHNKKKIKNIEFCGFISICLVGLMFLAAGLCLYIKYETKHIISIAFLVGFFIILFSSLIVSIIDKLEDKLLKQNKDLTFLSPNAEYHKYHEDKELFRSEIVLNSLKLGFIDKVAKIYNESIDIKDFETVVADGITDTEVNLYEKKIYKPNPNFVSFHTGTPQNCSQQIHKNKRKINFKVLRGN